MTSFTLNKDFRDEGCKLDYHAFWLSDFPTADASDALMHCVDAADFHSYPISNFAIVFDILDNIKKIGKGAKHCAF